VQFTRRGEAAFVAKPDIQQYEVRSQITDVLGGLGTRRCGVDPQPLPLEQRPRGLEEMGVIVDQKAAQRHVVSMSPEVCGAHTYTSLSSTEPSWSQARNASSRSARRSVMGAGSSSPALFSRYCTVLRCRLSVSAAAV
jgi:hypothetical protein